MQELNKYSKHVTQDPNQPAAQAMLYATGMEPEDMLKAQVGIASTGWDGNPCNMHLNGLAAQVKDAVWQEGLVGLMFHTIGVSDGISMGTSGMRYSLPSRDIIADSIETVVGAQWYDAVITVVGCDKNMPGAMIALARLNRPSILMYGGTIRPGYRKGEKLDIVSAFEALGNKLSGNLDEAGFQEIIRNACPGPGACGGMYTANTMASAIEALGMSLPYNGSIPATHDHKEEEAKRYGAAIRTLLEKNILPSDIMTEAAFRNAMTVVMCLGGSTNAVIHLLAMAHAAGIPLDLKDFQAISDRTPYLADLKPSGKYVMEDLFKAGGTPGVMKLLLEEGYLDGSCLTATGKSMEENLAALPALDEGQDVIHPFSNPIKPTGHIQVLYGNLAKEGAVAKITGKEGEKFTGPAQVFNSEEEVNKAIMDKMISPGTVLVVRYCGPKGAPGMPEMLKPTSLIMGAGLGNTVALITDGRFSGGTHGFVVGHITPEAYAGGTIALIEQDDIITIDAEKNTLEVHLPDEVLMARRTKWQVPDSGNLGGALKKYRQLVSSASKGCITDGD